MFFNCVSTMAIELQLQSLCCDVVADDDIVSILVVVAASDDIVFNLVAVDVFQSEAFFFNQTAVP